MGGAGQRRRARVKWRVVLASAAFGEVVLQEARVVVLSRHRAAAAGRLVGAHVCWERDGEGGYWADAGSKSLLNTQPFRWAAERTGVAGDVHGLSPRLGWHTLVVGRLG